MDGNGPFGNGGGRPTAVLTGASRGIGRATVELLRERGWLVLTVSRTPLPGEEETHIVADLTDLGAIDETANAIRAKLPNGKLQALVNNAGISPKGRNGERLGVEESDAAMWSAALNVNLISPALLSRALLPELCRGHGAIVNITSIVGCRVHPFAGAAYAASKAGLTTLTREMAREFAKHGVRANAVAPGEIDTSILSPGTAEIVARDVPMERLGAPREVAEAILFLCSRASSYVNGAELHVNGGQHV